MAGVMLTVRMNEQMTPTIIVSPTVRIGAIGEMKSAEKPIVSVSAQSSVALPVVSIALLVDLKCESPASRNSTMRLATCSP